MSSFSTEHTDPVNSQILATSEDKIQGFVREPFQEIATRSGVPLETVLERIRAMLAAGTIRRVRQTLVASNLAEGALVAWQVPEEKLNDAFDWMFQNDPFSGHVVIRSTDQQTTGSAYRLWTTLKTPQGSDMVEHCRVLMRHTGCTKFKLMPAKGIFALGVGHVRRKVIEPGDRADAPAKMIPVGIVQLSDLEWDVLLALKRELTLDEINLGLWAKRSAEAGVDLDTFCRVAEDLNRRQVIGRFSTFLEHVKPSQGGQRVTKFNALFHWRVPAGREVEAGGEVGRHPILTHCYWREGGPDFCDVNVMAVCHGTEKDRVFAHKAAIDAHLASIGIPVSYTNVFWGGRSEIKPSEISPKVHREWLARYSAEPALA
jgi:DNA-binding Lrp family transcriptional regulator